MSAAQLALNPGVAALLNIGQTPGQQQAPAMANALGQGAQQVAQAMKPQAGPPAPAAATPPAMQQPPAALMQQMLGGNLGGLKLGTGDGGYVQQGDQRYQMDPGVMQQILAASAMPHGSVPRGVGEGGTVFGQGANGQPLAPLANGGRDALLQAAILSDGRPGSLDRAYQTTSADQQSADRLAVQQQDLAQKGSQFTQDLALRQTDQSRLKQIADYQTSPHRAEETAVLGTKDPVELARVLTQLRSLNNGAGGGPGGGPALDPFVALPPQIQQMAPQADQAGNRDPVAFLKQVYAANPQYAGEHAQELVQAASRFGPNAAPVLNAWINRSGARVLSDKATSLFGGSSEDANLASMFRNALGRAQPSSPLQNVLQHAIQTSGQANEYLRRP